MKFHKPEPIKIPAFLKLGMDKIYALAVIGAIGISLANNSNLVGLGSQGIMTALQWLALSYIFAMMVLMFCQSSRNLPITYNIFLASLGIIAFHASQLLFGNVIAVLAILYLYIGAFAILRSFVTYRAEELRSHPREMFLFALRRIWLWPNLVKI